MSMTGCYRDGGQNRYGSKEAWVDTRSIQIGVRGRAVYSIVVNAINQYYYGIRWKNVSPKDMIVDIINLQRVIGFQSVMV